MCLLYTFFLTITIPFNVEFSRHFMFDNLVMILNLLYVVEVWGGDVSKSTWNEFENVWFNYDISST